MAGENLRRAGRWRRDLRIALGFAVCEPVAAFERSNQREGSDERQRAHGSSGAYKAGSLSLAGAVAIGTGVMIGAGIFALTGQVAQFAGPLFPLAFVVAAIVSAFSSYSYIKLASAMWRHRKCGSSGLFVGA